MFTQHERVPKAWARDPSTGDDFKNGIRLLSNDTGGWTFALETVAPNVFRTTFTSPTHPLPPFPSAKRPTSSPVPPAELFRRDASAIPAGQQTATFTQDDAAQTARYTCGGVAASLSWTETPVLHLSLAGVLLHEDLPFRSYTTDADGVAYYSRYDSSLLYVGLGEKAAPMDLSGRSFAITASDTFGYDAYRTDPLYKHLPLLISMSPAGCVGIFSTSHARAQWNIGSEIDGLWGRYKVYRQAHGGLEQYFLIGKTVGEVVRLYADYVIGARPLLMPRWMMGYVSGGMAYSMTDEPPAEENILRFLERCEKNDIPVSAFQMSSGYTVAETEPKTRNVFTWNNHRFPDPRAWTKVCHAKGVRLLSNVKPYVLKNHPAYKDLAERGAFFTDPDDREKRGQATARLWSAGGGESGEGGHLDMTSKAGYEWWYEGVRKLREVGIDGIWNDNNEYNIARDDWECALENRDVVPVPEGETRKDLGLWGRAINTELTGRASHDACLAFEPDVRPMVLTRSATAGTMRWCASSWSGDNVTSWESMKGGNAMALNAGMSLIQCYGHDTGGFEGPQPTPELLVRWIQLAIHTPRFTINCFKTSAEDNLVGGVIEPWMYPEVTPLIRAAIKRRYELIPYTYSQCLLSHATAIPPLRWVGWGYEGDTTVWADATLRKGDTQFWFGDALVIAGVYTPGEASAKVYLPSNGDDDEPGFVNINAPYQHLASGQWHDINAPWTENIAVLARVGSAIPVGKPVHTRAYESEDPEFPSEQEDDWRGVEIFPLPADAKGAEMEKKWRTKVFTSSWLEDDGRSCVEKNEMVRFVVHYRADEEAVRVLVFMEPAEDGKEPETRKGFVPIWCRRMGMQVDVILPVGEAREVFEGKNRAQDRGVDERGRRRWAVSVQLRSVGEDGSVEAMLG